MANHGIVPDDVPEAFAPRLGGDRIWRIGQGTTDSVIDAAYDGLGEFWIDYAAGSAIRVYLGTRCMGLLDRATLKFIRWPSVGVEFSERLHIERLHRVADDDPTFAKCYFIGGDTGAVKIGFSVDVDGRLRTMRAHSPVPLGILATCPGGESREAAYHAQFAAHRLHGEWFERCPEIEAEITRLSPSSQNDRRGCEV